MAKTRRIDELTQTIYAAYHFVCWLTLGNGELLYFSLHETLPPPPQKTGEMYVRLIERILTSRAANRGIVSGTE